MGASFSDVFRWNDALNIRWLDEAFLVNKGAVGKNKNIVPHLEGEHPKVGVNIESTCKKKMIKHLQVAEEFILRKPGKLELSKALQNSDSNFERS